MPARNSASSEAVSSLHSVALQPVCVGLVARKGNELRYRPRVSKRKIPCSTRKVLVLEARIARGFAIHLLEEPHGQPNVAGVRGCCQVVDLSDARGKLVPPWGRFGAGHVTASTTTLPPTARDTRND